MRNKKIAKKEGVFKTQGKAEKIENEEVEFAQIKQKMKWFDQEIFDVLKTENVQKEIQPKEVDSEEESEQEKEQTKESKKKKLKELDEELEKSSDDEERVEFKDDDELAEILAISRKMLRKKDRRQIIDDSYNRYNYPEDPSTLPHWFYDDEKKHIGKIPGVTKEDVQREKERLKVLKARLPKKVLEAKMRQKKKAMNKLMKARSKVQEVFDSENTPFSKARQINDIYKKAVRQNKPKKQVVVAKRHLMNAPNKKSGRKFKVVDKRQRKDERAMKKVERNKKIKKVKRNFKRR